MFDQAAADQAGSLDEGTAINLIQKLSGQITTDRIKQKLAVSVVYIYHYLSSIIYEMKIILNTILWCKQPSSYLIGII
jgi:hypothetical protein